MKQLTVASIAIIAALVLGVGLATGLVLRHVVQTLPLAIGAALGTRFRPVSWFALPCFAFWLGLMAEIWLSLLGIAHLVNGHFTAFEIAMTVVVASAALVGIVSALRLPRTLPIGTAAGLFVLGAALQWTCFRISMLPGIAHR